MAVSDSLETQNMFQITGGKNLSRYEFLTALDVFYSKKNKSKWNKVKGSFKDHWPKHILAFNEVNQLR